METTTYTYAFSNSFGFMMADTFLTFGIISIILFIMYKSKRLMKAIEDSPVLFAVIAMFIFGFIGWLLWWAAFEIIATIQDKENEEGDEVLPKTKMKAPKMPKTKKPKKAPPAPAPKEKSEEKVYI